MSAQTDLQNFLDSQKELSYNLDTMTDLEIDNEIRKWFKLKVKSEREQQFIGNGQPIQSNLESEKQCQCILDIAKQNGYIGDGCYNDWVKLFTSRPDLFGENPPIEEWYNSSSCKHKDFAINYIKINN